MTILAIDGFDLYNGIGGSLGLLGVWNVGNFSYGVNPSMSSPGRFAAGQCFNGSNGNNSSASVSLPMPSANSAFAICHAVNAGTLGSVSASDTGSLMAACSGGAGNKQVHWHPSPTGQIVVRRGATELGRSAAGVLQNGVWHFVEFIGTINATTGTVTIKVDGVQVLALTAQNTNGYATNLTFDTVLMGMDNFFMGNQNFYFDDLYVTDGVSLGERRVETLRPASDVTKMFTPDTGTVNFSRVNATLAQSTTFVQDGTLNDADLYTLAALSSNASTIDAVAPVIYAQKTDAQTRAIAALLDIAGVQSQSANFTLAGSVARYSGILTAKPGGGAWAYTDVNSLRLGPKVTV